MNNSETERKSKRDDVIWKLRLIYYVLRCKSKNKEIYKRRSERIGRKRNVGDSLVWPDREVSIVFFKIKTADGDGVVGPSAFYMRQSQRTET